MTSKPDAVGVEETEEQLIAKAQQAVSQCNWVVGECAVQWTKKYARGRTDADFAAQVGLSADQVYQRRRVWERFGEAFQEYRSLKWSHFYVALNWDDAFDCLQWAEDNEATVAEMRAWRRALVGEDVSSEPPPDPWAGNPSIRFVPSQPTTVRQPSEFGLSEEVGADSRRAATRGEGETAETVSGVAREAERGDTEYAPFRKGAASPAPQDVAVAERPQPSAEQVIRRMTSTVKRINEKLTPQLIREMRRLPEPARREFVRAVGDLSLTVGELL